MTGKQKLEQASPLRRKIGAYLLTSGASLAVLGLGGGITYQYVAETLQFNTFEDNPNWPQCSEIKIYTPDYWPYKRDTNEVQHVRSGVLEDFNVDYAAHLKNSSQFYIVVREIEKNTNLTFTFVRNPEDARMAETGMNVFATNLNRPKFSLYTRFKKPIGGVTPYLGAKKDEHGRLFNEIFIDRYFCNRKTFAHEFLHALGMAHRYFAEDTFMGRIATDNSSDLSEYDTAWLRRNYPPELRQEKPGTEASVEGSRKAPEIRR